MKILLVNTYHYLRGGDCRNTLGLGALLKDKGHHVHYFAMKGKMNLPCPEEHYFVSEVDYREAIERKNLITTIKVIWRSIYSVEARNNIARLLDEIKPDIAHLHSIRHHLTKAILPELAKRNIPVVWTLHDFKEICPNTSFHNGRSICERCKGGNYLNIIHNRCKKGSLPASLITYIEAKVNNGLGYDKYIDLYLSPSIFLRNKFIEYGFDPDKIIHLPNFVDLDVLTPSCNYENYLLYIGRLENGKGLRTLIKGVTKATAINPAINLKIAGTGSDKDEIIKFIQQAKMINIEMLGFKKGNELERLTKNAKAIVIPSELYENYPYSGLEAMSYGKPIIASRIGGIPEQVEDGVTGFLYESFDSNDLAKKIQLLNKLSKEEILTMGQKAREKVEQINNKGLYLSRILGIYQKLIKRNNLNNTSHAIGN